MGALGRRGSVVGGCACMGVCVGVAITNQTNKRTTNKHAELAIKERRHAHTEIENERTKRAAAKSAKQTQTHTERENEKKKEE